MSPFLYGWCCRSQAERRVWRLVCLTLTLTVFSGCGAKDPPPEAAVNSGSAAQAGEPASVAEKPAATPTTSVTSATSAASVASATPAASAAPATSATPAAPGQKIDPDAPPPPPPVLGVMVGEDADKAHNALAVAYRQTRWTSKEAVLVREYEARDPDNPFQRVVLETCQSDDAVIAVRVSGTNARLFYEAVHKRFAFRFVERARDVPGMDPGPGPGMPFARQYADGVELSLTTLPEGSALLLLESPPLRQRCAADFVEAKRRMNAFFLEREQARKTNKQDAL